MLQTEEKSIFIVHLFQSKLKIRQWIKYLFACFFFQNGSSGLSDYCDGVLRIAWFTAICHSTATWWQNI